MRIPLAAAPSNIRQEFEPVRSREASESWRSWVAIKCPREELPKPEEAIRLLNNLKPYSPPWGG